MNVFFLYAVFHLSKTIFIEWENCNILDGNGDVSTLLLMLIKKSTFGYLSNMKKKQLETLARGFFLKTIIICDHPSKGGGQPYLKSMHKFTMLLKKKVVV